MTTSSKTIAFTWSPDGSGDSLQQTFTPAAGEAYYVETVRIESDGQGGVTTADFAAKIVKGSAGNEANLTADQIDTNVKPKATAGNIVDDTNGATATAVLGVYLTEDHNLYVLTSDNSNASAATFYIVVELRQVQ